MIYVIAPDGGTTTTVRTLAQLAAASDLVGARIVVTSTQTLAADLVWPSDRQLEVVEGGSITGAHTLTINGPFKALDTRQIFTGSIAVVFSADSINHAFTDWFASLQAAVTATAGVLLVWSHKTYTTTVCLNATNRGATPTMWLGSGFNADCDTVNAGTILKGQTAADGTASPGYIVDFSGSQNISIAEFNFLGAGANASTRGMLFARTTSNHFVQQINLHKCCVKIASAPVGGTVGSIGIVNIQAEQFVMDHCSIYADTPYFSTLKNDITYHQLFASPYATLYNLTSTTVQQHRQNTFYAYTQSAMILSGTQSSSFSDCVWAQDPGNSTTAAISIIANAGDSQALSIDGQVEGFPTGIAFVTAGMTPSDIRTRLNIVKPSAAHAFVDMAATTSAYNCHFNNKTTDNALIGGTTNAIAMSFGTKCTLLGGSLTLYQNMTPFSSGYQGAGSFVVGGTYQIKTVGTTDFTALGASANTVGISFIASGVGTGTGDAYVMPSNYTFLDYRGGGIGNYVSGITAGTNMFSLAAPYTAYSKIDGFGNISLTGILQASGNIGGGDTIGTISSQHVPNRTIYFTAIVIKSGVTSSVVAGIAPTGAISINTTLVSGNQVIMDGIFCRQIN